VYELANDKYRTKIFRRAGERRELVRSANVYTEEVRRLRTRGGEAVPKRRDVDV